MYYTKLRMLKRLNLTMEIIKNKFNAIYLSENIIREKKVNSKSLIS